MRGWVWAAGLLLAPLAWADQVPPRYAEHDRVLTEPQAVIQHVRQQLDRDEALDPARERAALWWMGTAGINIGDDAALAEATLRLDSHLLESGGQGGLAEALRAAAQVQDTHDDALAAWATFQLCDAYTMDENAEGAVPVCLRAETAYRQLGDSWGMAEAENNLGINYASQQRIDNAVALYQRARQHFKALGADAWAASVGDNLARVELQVAASPTRCSLAPTSPAPTRRWASRRRRCAASAAPSRMRAVPARTACCPTCCRHAVRLPSRQSTTGRRWRTRAK
ncbi:MAG: hypothetical protein ABT19_04385 [Rhodanobacter sp. SCN 68-63]|nr:MAG: hypothetical protein ABT19_04385 [Rhodanobacter sp. SCN 68-63]